MRWKCSVESGARARAQGVSAPRQLSGGGSRLAAIKHTTANGHTHARFVHIIYVGYTRRCVHCIDGTTRPRRRPPARRSAERTRAMQHARAHAFRNGRYLSRLNCLWKLDHVPSEAIGMVRRRELCCRFEGSSVEDGRKFNGMKRKRWSVLWNETLAKEDELLLWKERRFFSCEIMTFLNESYTRFFIVKNQYREIERLTLRNNNNIGTRGKSS